MEFDGLRTWMNLEDALIMPLEGNTWRIYTFYIYLKWEHLQKQHHTWNHSIILLEILLKMNSYNGKKVRVPRTRAENQGDTKLKSRIVGKISSSNRGSSECYKSWNVSNWK